MLFIHFSFYFNLTTEINKDAVNKYFKIKHIIIFLFGKKPTLKKRK